MGSMTDTDTGEPLRHSVVTKLESMSVIDAFAHMKVLAGSIDKLIALHQQQDAKLEELRVALAAKLAEKYAAHEKKLPRFYRKQPYHFRPHLYPDSPYVLTKSQLATKKEWDGKVLLWLELLQRENDSPHARHQYAVLRDLTIVNYPDGDEVTFPAPPAPGLTANDDDKEEA